MYKNRISNEKEKKECTATHRYQNQKTFTCEADDYSTSVNLGCKYLKACNVLRNGISSNPG